MIKHTLYIKSLVSAPPSSENAKLYYDALLTEKFQTLVTGNVSSILQNDHGGSAWVLNRKFATYQKMSIVCTSKTDDDDTAFRYTHLGKQIFNKSVDKIQSTALT